MRPRTINLYELRQNNLKGFDLALPFHKLIAITGVSGSGKSSLALETLYAEGQRRYVETFSAYARQFLERMPRPRVRRIENIPPAIAIEQTNPVKNSRSTVGTLTEVSHFVKMLFYREATPVCPDCGRPIVPASSEEVAADLLATHEDAKAIITAPVRVKQDFQLLRKGLVQAGYHRVLADGAVRDILGIAERDKVEVVIDRLILSHTNRARLVDSMGRAFALGHGKAAVHIVSGETLLYSADPACPYCDRKLQPKSPNLFSFNSPVGACSECHGFGRIIDVDWDLVVPNPMLSIDQGAVKVFEAPAAWEEKQDMLSFCRAQGIPTDRPWAQLPQKARDAILFGRGRWYGVKGFFQWLESKRYKAHVRIFLSRYRAYLTCPICRGARFTAEALLYRLDGLNIAQIYSMSIGEARRYMENLGEDRFDTASKLLFQEIYRRLTYLCAVGLDYLTLDRQSRTLSGGEVARAMLTRALASNLIETLYILDEPTKGLHARDVARVVDTMRRLSAQNNTVCVVEHDPVIIKAADLVVELGPGAGQKGGRLVYLGSPTGLKDKDTTTAEYLSGRPSKLSPKNIAEPDSFIYIKGAEENNLKGIDVSIPKRRLTVITGVSGSGKSTLLELVLYRGALRQKGISTERPGKCYSIEGLEDIEDIILVDQSPIGRTPRANPATYLKLYDPIRKLLASSEEARQRNLSPSAFSFNVAGGRCEECNGQGFERVEMQFLSDLYLPCPVCKGKRFRPEILQIKYRGKNVSQILDMTFEEAVEFFAGNHRLNQMLQGPVKIGLGYLRLGQPIHTLSGGEAQRLKLAHMLFTSPKTNCLLLIDEPTVGLHLQDVATLMTGLEWLVEKGNTVVIVEHCMDVITRADWIIDLGPEGGKNGGQVVFEGKVTDLPRARDSITGRCLMNYIAGKEQAPHLGRTTVQGRAPDGIRIVGARHHNMKNLSLEIPRNKLVVITGVSGSGKSTLAFDIIFAEGQRRYVESLSTYARQFLRLYERPDADLIEGLPPTVAIEQLMSQAGPRSTVGTLTEIYHYLRLLYARLSEPHCLRCGRTLAKKSVEEMLLSVLRDYEGQDIVILAPVVRRRKGFHKEILKKMYRRGYRSAEIDGQIVNLDEGIPSLGRYIEHNISAVVGHVTVCPEAEVTLRTLAKNALKEGKGEAIVRVGKEDIFLSEQFFCPHCGIGLPGPDPLLFSFNTTAGACPKCDGIGRTSSGRVCRHCGGSRLRREALAYKINNLNIAQISALSATQALEVLSALTFDGNEAKIAGPILDECLSRLALLKKLGLGYLGLDRPGDSLSGGEAQRVRLVCELGGNLTGICYVLDEPTIGLHPRDNSRLLEALKKIRDRGNSVVVVEHDEDTLKSADWVVDLGPGGGEKGGKAVYQGSPRGLSLSEYSATAKAFNNPNRYQISSLNRSSHAEQWCFIERAKARNLKDISVKFPLGAITCVTGVSGSGKSTLLMEVIHASLVALLRRRKATPVQCSHLSGHEAIKKVMVVDHSPIGRTPRSTPATYIGVMGDIRKLLACLPEARARGWSAGRFSFNLKDGRCNVCDGQGTLKVEMRFLPKVYVSCEQCAGARYNTETLAVKYKGKNISDILNMTFSEAAEFFAAMPKIRRSLRVVDELGLGYLRLGQPSPTLSGGEAQRIKLAKAFVKNSTGGALYLLDEPTTGLHLADIEKLLRLFHLLVNRGNTIIVIEHNLDIIKEADWVIDLGPKGGEQGGKLIFQGPPSGLLTCTQSYTGHYLRKFLDSCHHGS